MNRQQLISRVLKPAVFLAALVPLVEESGLPVIPYDGHYVPAANRAMASLVATALLERGSGSASD